MGMETGKPTIKQSKEFAEDVLAVCPNLMLAYNNSPSFNWDAAGMSDDEMETFIWDLGKMGYCWQFILLQDSTWMHLYLVVCKTIQGQGHAGLCKHDPTTRARAWSGNFD